MTTVEIVMAVVMFAIAGLWLFLGIRSFMERGFLLNNAYIYATKEERKTMDKKPYYRQSAVAFCLLSVIFVSVYLFFSKTIQSCCLSYRLPLPLSYTQSCLLFCFISAQSNMHRFKHTLPESRRNRRLSGSVVMPETALRAPAVKKLL